MSKEEVHVARFNTSIPSDRKDALSFLRNPRRIKLSRWRYETLAGRVLAHGVSGRVVTLYRDVCREELGEDV